MERLKLAIQSVHRPLEDDDIAYAIHEAFLVDYPKVRDFILRGGWPGQEVKAVGFRVVATSRAVPNPILPEENDDG